MASRCLRGRTHEYDPISSPVFNIQGLDQARDLYKAIRRIQKVGDYPMA